MNGFDSAGVILAVGAALAVVVQLAVLLGAAKDARTTVLVAAVAGFLLTLLYAVSNSLLSVPNLFGLVVAWITVTATGAGVHSASTALVTNTTTPKATP